MKFLERSAVKKLKMKKDELWKEAYRRCQLSVRHIQMAKELGLNPKSLIKNIPNPKQKWKLPVRNWIQQMYVKRFKKHTKKKDAANEMKIVVGIGCYKREDWERFLACADDRKDLENTYDEFLISFNKAVADIRTAGLEPRKVVVNLDELLDYCKNFGLKNNAQTRARFFAELTKQGRIEEIN